MAQLQAMGQAKLGQNWPGQARPGQSHGSKTALAWPKILKKPNLMAQALAPGLLFVEFGKNNNNNYYYHCWSSRGWIIADG